MVCPVLSASPLPLPFNPGTGALSWFAPRARLWLLRSRQSAPLLKSGGAFYSGTTVILPPWAAALPDEFRLGLLNRRPRMGAAHDAVGARHHEQREQRAERHAAGDDPADLHAAFSARPARKDQSGTAPSTMAEVVMRMGRSRSVAPSTMASTRDAALLLHPVGEINDQDAVLGDQPDERHQPDLRIDVQACPR